MAEREQQIPQTSAAKPRFCGESVRTCVNDRRLLPFSVLKHQRNHGTVAKCWNVSEKKEEEEECNRCRKHQQNHETSGQRAYISMTQDNVADSSDVSGHRNLFESGRRRVTSK